MPSSTSKRANQKRKNKKVAKKDAKLDFTAPLNRMAQVLSDAHCTSFGVFFDEVKKAIPEDRGNS
jgi:hypothetical protein